LQQVYFALKLSIDFEDINFVVFLRFELYVGLLKLVVLLLHNADLVLDGTLSFKDGLNLFIFQIHSFGKDLLLNVQLVDCRNLVIVAVLLLL